MTPAKAYAGTTGDHEGPPIRSTPPSPLQGLELLRLLASLLGLPRSPQLLQSITQGSVRGSELGIKRNSLLIRGCSITVSPQRQVDVTYASICSSTRIQHR